jgi:hypothetical protein
MIKSIFKVLYIGFAVIMAILVYIAGYNTNAFNYINNITSDAINNKNYVEVAKIHGGCFETINVVDKQPSLNKNNYELAIYKSGTLLTEEYYISDEDKTQENEYVNSYYIFLFGLTDTLDASTDGTTLTNKTAFNFVGTEGTYTYYFKVSSVYNTSYYNNKPKSVSDALLGDERDLFSNQNNWGFVNLTFTETLLDSMNIGDVKQIQVTDAIGDVVFTQDVVLDFNKETGFFNEISPLVINYNEYIDNVTGDASDEDINKAESKFNEFYLKFEENFLKNENNSFRHEDSYLQPSKLVWKTIGLLCLYGVSVLVLYILLFNFTFIKKIFVRNSYSNDYGTRAVNKNKKTAIDAEVKEIKEEKVEETETLESKSE